jgi:ABC-2 type transport system ATP-binding protein
MWEIIKSLMDKGTTILLTTQYLEEADQLADQIVVIDHGIVIAKGTSSELKRKVGNDRLELTFGSEAVAKKAVAALDKKVIDSNAKDYTATIMIVNPNTDVREVLDILATNKIAVTSMAIHKPSLDDVFLSLTGKPKPAAAKTEGK